MCKHGWYLIGTVLNWNNYLHHENGRKFFVRVKRWPKPFPFGLFEGKAALLKLRLRPNFTNINTNSLTPLHHKASDLITLIKYIGVEFWGNWYELVFIIAWLLCCRWALKWLCLSFLKSSWDMLLWSTRFIAWEKIFKRSVITPDSLCIQAVFIACHWDNNLIWQADCVLLKLKDSSCLTAHVRCRYEDLLHAENQEDCVTGLVCR